MPTAADRQIGRGLRRFAEARGQARRFHRADLGDVDPQKCFGDFLWSVRAGDRGRLEKVYRSPHEKGALAESSGVTGGYAVPPELRYDLMQDVGDAALFRPHAHVVDMAGDTLSLPLPDATTAPSAAGVAPFWGGLKMQWARENAARPETEPQVRQLELTAWWLGGYALESGRLAQDGGAGLDSWLRVLFARSIAWYEDYAFLQGTGVGQPLGVLNAPGTVLATRNTPGHFKVADAQAMWADFYGVGDGCWLATRAAGADVTALTGWIPNGPMELYGLPVLPTTKLPALGTAGDLVLADRSLYVIGDRGQVLIEYAREEPTAFLKFQEVWRFSERVDGQPLLGSAVTLPDGGTTKVSPFVALNT